MLKSRYNENDSLIEVGIDEAGRGCLWGPLIAAAVIWLPENEWEDEHRAISTQIKDSKKLSHKKRSILRKQIENLAVDYSIGRVEADEIDKVGMTRANRLAFERALSGLDVEPDRIIIDGILSIVSEKEQIVQPEADGKYLAVAAASILAKETHDEIVDEICKAEPQIVEKYDLAKCKGYGTAKHRKGVETHGIHKFHRKLFLRKLLGQTIYTPSNEKQTDYHFMD